MLELLDEIPNGGHVKLLDQVEACNGPPAATIGGEQRYPVWPVKGNCWYVAAR